MKRLLKCVVVLALAAVVVVAVTEGTGNSLIDGLVSDVQSAVNSAVDTAVSETTETVIEEVLSQIADSSDVAAVATAIMAGDTVSDETYISALGGDAESYYQVKQAAASYGVDLNDGAQLRQIVVDNLGNLDELEDVINDYLEGGIDVEELMSQLNDMLDLS